MVSSANIACGFHAGDPVIMGRTVQMAKDRKVLIGEYPGLPDLMGFGRRVIQVDSSELEKHLDLPDRRAAGHGQRPPAIA